MDLSLKIKQLKKTIAEKEDRDKALRQKVRVAIEVAFNGKKIPASFLRDFYLQNKKLIIITTNKSFSNELLFKKEFILNKVREIEVGITDILIK